MSAGPLTEVALDLDALLAPRSIAVVGASTDPGAYAGRTVANLQRTGYAGAIHPVNPRHARVAGLSSAPTIRDVDGAVDLAYLLVRAELVASVVEGCVDKGVRAAVICAAGFAELSEAGRREQETIAATARAGGMRLLGPNCIGVVNVVDNVVGCSTLNITTSHTPGRIAIVSQSGGMGVNLFNRAQGRGIGVRALVSVGNEADVETAELVEAFAADPATDVVALVVEQLRDGPRFCRAVERAHAAGTHVVVLKVGRSEAGRRSTLGHTGALAGEHAVFSAVCRQLGVLQVDGVDALIDLAHLLSTTPRPRGNRLAVVSPSGGECGYVADRAETGGLHLPPLGADTAAELGTLMRFAVPDNPLDPTGQIIGDPGLLQRVLALVLADDSFDMAAFAVPTWGAHDAQRLLPAFVEAARSSAKPVVVSEWSAHDLTERADAVLRTAGIAAFPSADQAVDALVHLHRYWAARDAVRPTPPDPAPMSHPAGLGERPDEHAVKRFLAGHGIPVAGEQFVTDAEQAVAAARTLGWPVVLKAVCPGVVHKSDLGLVLTGVADEQGVRAGVEHLGDRARAAGVELAGVLVCEQVHGLELIVGGVRDTTFGPVVALGAGGTLAEYLDDVTFLRAPVDADTARAALGSLRVGRVLAGARGIAHDVDAAAAVVARVSQLLAAAPWIAELDLNPVIVRPLGPDGPAAGAVVVDAVLNAVREQA